MLRQLSREHESHGGLNLTRRKSLLLVVSDQLNGLLSDSVKDIVNEGVHDTHGLLADSSVGVNLLQHLEDVDAEVLSSLSASGSLLKHMHVRKSILLYTYVTTVWVLSCGLLSCLRVLVCRHHNEL